MNDIHILVTMPQHAVFRTFFDADAMAALEHIGTVHWNTLGRQYTQDELGAAVRGMDISQAGEPRSLMKRCWRRRTACVSLPTREAPSSPM